MRTHAKKVKIEGLLVIDPVVIKDSRGFFMETWNRNRYRLCGIEVDFVQDNVSVSSKNILRGLHFQNPNSQGKLVHVLQGKVFDVAVDLRRRSPTYSHWHGVILSGENKRQFYIPSGFAHGFVVLSDKAIFHYKCTKYYSPRHEVVIRWNDPDIGIRWPVSEPTLNPRDAKAPFLSEVDHRRLFD